MSVQRSFYIAGLRDLADALEANPDLPLPGSGAFPYPSCLSVAARTREGMQAWADVLTDARERPTDNGLYQIHGRLAGLHLYAWASAEALGREVTREQPVFEVEPFLPGASS